MPKKKVLIADDEKMIRGVIKILVSEQGHEIHETDDGVQALRIAREVVPDLVILDMMMPGMLGYEVCKRLKENEETKNVYVMLITGLGQQAQSVLQECGGDELVAKPFHISDLRERIIKVLENDGPEKGRKTPA